MDRDLSDLFRNVFCVLVLFILVTIGIVLINIGTRVTDTVTDSASKAAAESGDTDAYWTATFDKPVPVATIWRVATNLGKENITSFKLKERNTINQNNWDLISTQVSSLDDYIDRKGYMSWSANSNGSYTMEVFLEK